MNLLFYPNKIQQTHILVSRTFGPYHDRKFCLKGHLKLELKKKLFFYNQ
jgi:hypothetical protein